MAATKDHWPLGKGFDRSYGFLGGETNQWYPDLVKDNQMIDQPYPPEEGYHLSKDLVDQAIGMIADAKQVVPDKPFFMYLTPGAGHAPHHVAKEWADKYKGKFDSGYEQYAKDAIERMKQMGIVPENTVLAPMNSMADATSAEGTRSNPPARTPSRPLRAGFRVPADEDRDNQPGRVEQQEEHTYRPVGHFKPDPDSERRSLAAECLRRVATCVRSGHQRNDHDERKCTSGVVSGSDRAG